MAKLRYRVNSTHSIALSGGGMHGPGAEVSVDVSKSAYDKRLVDEGVLVPLDSPKPRGGAAKQSTIADEDATKSEDAGE